MGCLVGALALLFPRLALIGVWLWGPAGYLSRPFPGIVWPILGFIFLPTTTLAFSYATQSLGHGEVTPLGWVLIVIAILIDLGLLGGGGRAARRRRRREE
ncbi:MAG: hypothetical protein IT378_13345 [Sandaracinaceae bacterium]|nr:hypothetical protein [Sandaracinaceae bacterium]